MFRYWYKDVQIYIGLCVYMWVYVCLCLYLCASMQVLVSKCMCLYEGVHACTPVAFRRQVVSYFHGCSK